VACSEPLIVDAPVSRFITTRIGASTGFTRAILDHGRAVRIGSPPLIF
jgi:hypothetical protein